MVSHTNIHSITLQYQMGNQQNSKNQAQLAQISEADLISDIFESQSPSNIEDRALEAIRISEEQRKEDRQGSQLSMINNKQISEPMLKDLCKLPRNTSTQQIGEKYLLTGVLIKEEPSVLFKQFTERYCFLTQKKFIYNENTLIKGERAGILNFDLLSCTIETQVKNGVIENFRIKVNGCEKLFLFHGQTEAQSRKWIEALTQVTDKSFGRQYNLTYLSHYHRFWRKDYLSQKQFREKAETGDIILMRGLTQTAVMQRAITQEEYDHVALVLKNIKNQVLLFQANGAVGVGVLPWHRFISKQYFKQQEIVVYRKLKVQRTQEFYEQFQQFVQRNMGRKYKFSVKKYLMNRESTDSQDKKSYFCSSLVAKLYKNLQLLDEKVSSVQYMPHSFTQKEGLQLRQNGKYGPAKLGNEHIIVFEKLFFEKNN